MTQGEIKSFYEITGASTGTLLYRASRDGYHPSTFHARCDGRARTVSIIKTKTNYIFGGYTAAAWSSTASYATDSSAYLFRFRSNGVSTLNKYGFVSSTNYQYAIYRHPLQGPTFGYHDIRILTQSDGLMSSGTSSQSVYSATSTTLAGATTWQISDIEVFQI